jgi:hypothetical protein
MKETGNKMEPIYPGNTAFPFLKNSPEIKE